MLHHRSTFIIGLQQLDVSCSCCNVYRKHDLNPEMGLILGQNQMHCQVKMVSRHSPACGTSCGCCECGVFIRADRKSQVKQSLGFCTAYFWPSLACESAEQKPKHCQIWGFPSALVFIVSQSGQWLTPIFSLRHYNIESSVARAAPGIIFSRWNFRGCRISKKAPREG